MRFPVVRERVRVQDRSGTFLVLSVDRAAGMAEVISTAKGSRAEKNVPLASILPLIQQPKSGEGKPDGSSGDGKA